MARHGSLEDLNKTNLDDLPAHVFANFEISRLLLVNLGFLGVSQKLVFSRFLMEFRRFRGFQEDRTNRTVLLAKFQPIWWYMVSESPLFYNFSVNWHFTVVEMASNTLHFVQGLSRTPLLFIPRYLTNIMFENISPKQKSRESKIWKSEMSKKPRLLTSAQKKKRDKGIQKVAIL